MNKLNNVILPSREELQKIINSKDFFVLANKGHQCINDILNEIISELLYDSRSGCGISDS